MINNEFSEKEESKEKTRECYINKMNKTLKWSIIILIFDIVTYIVFSVSGYSDFGIYLESATFILIYIAKNLLNQNSLNKVRKILFISIIPVGLLLAYDFIFIILNLKQIFQEIINYFYKFDFTVCFYILEMLDIPLIAIIGLLLITYKNICITIEYKTDEYLI